MGIKFNCPNGHKLNVKSFLAGKRGICPHCGVRLRIPAESEPEAADETLRSEEANGTMATMVAASAKPIADTLVFPELAAHEASASEPVAPVLAEAASPLYIADEEESPITFITAATDASSNGNAPVAAPAVSPAVPASPVVVTPIAVTAPVDPIAEAPSAVWYVRPPSGGQFGPARGDIMRKWLGEGRVSGDSLVWRDGWPQWQTASQVFPSLIQGVAASGPVPVVTKVAAPVGASTPNIATTASGAMRTLRPRKKAKNLSVAIVVGLGVISVILVAVFCIVVMGGLG